MVRVTRLELAAHNRGTPKARVARFGEPPTTPRSFCTKVLSRFRSFSREIVLFLRFLTPFLRFLWDPFVVPWCIMIPTMNNHYAQVSYALYKIQGLRYFFILSLIGAFVKCIFEKSELLQKEGEPPQELPAVADLTDFCNVITKNSIHQDQVKNNRFADTCQALLTEAFLPRKAIPIFMILEVPYTFI